MNKDMVTRVRSKWTKLSRTTLEKMDGDMQGLVRMVQAAYGYSRNQAEREFHDFQLTLRPTLRPLAPHERSR